MNHLKIFILIALIVAVSSARKAKRKRKLEIETVARNSTSFIARFKQYKRVKKYFVSISVKFLADASSHFVDDIVQSDLQEGGYYVINAVNTLQPGTLYELDIYNKRKYSLLHSEDFRTDCDEYSFQCEARSGKLSYQVCLESSSMCDGTSDCAKGEDERTEEDGSCSNVVPERPTPPPPSPPPADAPCILALERAIEESTTPVPDCDVNGLFSAMRCGEEGVHNVFTCHCIHPETGEVLTSQPHFDPFTHWDFGENCEKLRGEDPKGKKP